jgi:hypothetical protein
MVSKAIRAVQCRSFANTAVVFEVLPNLQRLFIFQQRFQQLKHAFAGDLIRRIQVIVRHGNIGRIPGSVANDRPTILAEMLSRLSFRYQRQRPALFQFLDPGDQRDSSRMVT